MTMRDSELLGGALSAPGAEKGLEAPEPQKLLTVNEAASYLGLSHQTLAQYRLQNKGPRYYKLGRNVRYSLRQLEDWLSQSERSCTSA